MKRPIESDYTSQVAYTRALEEYCDKLAQPEQEPVAWTDENVIAWCLARGVKAAEGITPPQTKEPEPAIIGTYLEKDKELMENAQGDLECIKLVQTGVGISKPEQEPVGSLSVRYHRGCKSMTNTDFDYYGDLPEGDYELYTTPPQRKPLSDEEIDAIDQSMCGDREFYTVLPEPSKPPTALRSRT